MLAFKFLFEILLEQKTFKLNKELPDQIKIILSMINSLNFKIPIISSYLIGSLHN